MAVNKALLQFLLSYASENKKSLFKKVLAQRTKHLTVVMENIFQTQNASAVLRTCECFGIQDIHFIIERYGKVETNQKVHKGSTKWLDIHEYPSTSACLQSLKAQGYTLVATSPTATESIEDLAITDKTAFLFGEELLGLLPSSLEAADKLVSIPMFGFTESLNVSVSAAICIRSFLDRLRVSEVPWQLTAEEKEALLLQWTIKSIRNPNALIKYFHQQHGTDQSS